jgi:hypothetical protein
MLIYVKKGTRHLSLFFTINPLVFLLFCCNKMRRCWTKEEKRSYEQSGTFSAA